jgi:hypothetical protein
MTALSSPARLPLKKMTSSGTAIIPGKTHECRQAVGFKRGRAANQERKPPTAAPRCRTLLSGGRTERRSEHQQENNAEFHEKRHGNGQHVSTPWLQYSTLLTATP